MRNHGTPHGWSRRAFVALGLGLFAAPILSARTRALARSRTSRGGFGASRGIVLGAGRVAIGRDERNVFCLFDLDGADARQQVIPLDFYGHGIAIDPLDPARIVLFEKKGKGACELDLREKRVVRPIATARDRHFYGHGAFASDGRLMYATESVISDEYRGVIVVRDARSFEELGVFPSYGARPHDCVLRDGGRTLVVTHGGGRGVSEAEAPSVTYVDVKTERLLERVPIPSPEFNAGHLALSARGDLAVVSAAAGGGGRDGLGAASFRAAGRDGEPLRIMQDPVEVTGRMRGEALSVALHEPSGVVGVTSPFASLVTFWDLKRGELVRSLGLAEPRGIALSLDGSAFVISYGRSTSLLEVSTESLEPVQGSRRTGLSMVGSHIAIHTLS